MVFVYLDLSEMHNWYSNLKSRVSASRMNVRIVRLNWGFEVTKWTVNWSDILHGMRLPIGCDDLCQNFSQTVSDWVT